MHSNEIRYSSWKIHLISIEIDLHDNIFRCFDSRKYSSVHSIYIGIWIYLSYLTIYFLFFFQLFTFRVHLAAVCMYIRNYIVFDCMMHFTFNFIKYFHRIKCPLIFWRRVRNKIFNNIFHFILYLHFHGHI